MACGDEAYAALGPLRSAVRTGFPLGLRSHSCRSDMVDSSKLAWSVFHVAHDHNLVRWYLGPAAPRTLATDAVCRTLGCLSICHVGYQLREKHDPVARWRLLHP